MSNTVSKTMQNLTGAGEEPKRNLMRRNAALSFNFLWHSGSSGGFHILAENHIAMHLMAVLVLLWSLLCVFSASILLHGTP